MLKALSVISRKRLLVIFFGVGIISSVLNWGIKIVVMDVR